MTPQQQLSCDAQNVCRRAKGDQTLLMSALVGIFARIAGVNLDCPTLSTLAAQYACLERQNQLPALIYLATLIATNGGTAGADYIDYPGPPVSNPPALQNIVVDVNGRQWQYYGNPPDWN